MFALALTVLSACEIRSANGLSIPILSHRGFLVVSLPLFSSIGTSSLVSGRVFLESSDVYGEGRFPFLLFGRAPDRIVRDSECSGELSNCTRFGDSTRVN